MSVIFKKAENVQKVVTWRVLLVKKMEKLGCDFEFHVKPNYHQDEQAMMNVSNPEFQPVPKVILGYTSNRDDNYYLPIICAHEMGHVVDYKQHKTSLQYYWRTLGTLEMEVRAWENAFRILREIGFHDFEEAAQFAKKCLATYFDSRNYLRLDNHFSFYGQSPTKDEAWSRIDKAAKDSKQAVRKVLLGQ